MEVKCTFYTEGWWPKNRPKYTCRIENQSITERKISWFLGDHTLEKHNEDVLAIWFDSCPMSKLPKNLADIFVNLDTLYINNCGLKSLSGDDLAKIPNLKELYIMNNEISHLSDDLLSTLKQLEMVTLSGNKTSTIGSKMINKIASDKLKMIDLRDNIVINAVFAKEIFLFPIGEDYMKISSLRKLAKIIKDKKELNKNSNCLFNDIKALLADDKFRDFKVIIKNETFKVHKFILVARSPVIAEMIYSNPDCSTLQLVDIPISVFQSILNYIYFDELPIDDANLIEIYAAACKLKIRGLKEHTIENLLDAVCAFNAVEILTISAKYGDQSLMVKSFEEIRKMFPDKRLKGDLMHQPEKIKEMITAKRIMDEQVRKVRENFDRQFSEL
ncbi:hypothetical protein PVAND_014536 [Polypedilum vanderplanki]|uniref:BTB domain-containing protein n=1 Tax=Polypedilum vanderplanki TaxID=319348 RepID=A0A9J6BAH0_POLVA|nr:hypothetical protein PVAND_014536 [Polypedilum vanderplanki]